MYRPDLQLFAKTMTFQLRPREHANDAIKSKNSENSRGPKNVVVPHVEWCRTHHICSRVVCELEWDR